MNLASPPSVHKHHVIPQPTYEIFGLNTGVKLHAPGLIVGMSIPHERQPETIPHCVRRRRASDMVLLMINETHIRRKGVSQILGQLGVSRERGQYGVIVIRREVVEGLLDLVQER